MKRKVIIEIDPECDEEVIIRCKSLTPEIRKLQQLAESGSVLTEEMSFHILDREYILPLSEILFFESSNDKTAAHTSDRMFYTDKTLRELEELLPRYFTRISKSCILNLKHVTSMKKSISGVCEIYLCGETKKVYASRMYYKAFRDKLTETRL